MNEIDKVNKLIHSGDFEKALAEIKRISESSITDEEVKTTLKIIESYTYNMMGDFKTTTSIINELLETNAPNIDDTLQTEAKIILAHALIDQGEKEKAQELCDVSEVFIKRAKFPNKNEKISFEASLFALKAKLAQKNNNLDQSVNYYMESIRLYRSLNFSYELANYLKSLGIIYASKGSFDQAIESLQESEFIFNQINSPINLLKICNNIGMVSWNKGELDEAVNYFEKAYNLAESLGNKNYLGVIRSNIGLVLWTKGDLDPALRSFERSKKIFEDLGIKVHLGSSLINIAIIYCNKGELEKSLQYNNDALALYTELNDKDNISKIYNNLGEIHQIKDDFDTAFEYFSKSLAIISEIGNPVIIGEVCLNIVQVASFKKDYELASSYSRRIYEMTQKDDSKLLNQTYRFSKALVLKLEGRLTSYAESQKMLNDIINEEKIKYELTIQAMLNLCEILINEIKFFGKEEIIAELEVLVSKLLDIARSQNLMQILVESLILQSKLSLFELDTKKAQDLLKQAQITAEERGLENLAILASVEYDLLLDKIEAFDFSKDSKISFAERFGLKELEDLIQRMITKNVNILPKQLSEEPILLLVVTDAGIPVYSKKFSLDAQYDDMLISGFLTAINSFIREAFSSEGSIERIKQKDFTLLFQTMDQLTFCYVIKGASYSALKKMDKFMLALKSSDMIWDEVMDSTQTGKSLEDLESINQLTEECFG